MTEETETWAATLQAYQRAQNAMVDLKTAVFGLLAVAGETGLRNADIGRSLGIYAGHEEHEGHIPRTILAMMQAEGVVEQDAGSKRWRLRSHLPEK
jgi:DNA-binding IclR family transcriptional regulator